MEDYAKEKQELPERLQNLVKKPAHPKDVNKEWLEPTGLQYAIEVQRL